LVLVKRGRAVGNAGEKRELQPPEKEKKIPPITITSFQARRESK